MKSNIEYLKEAIAKGEDATEWIEAIEDELKSKSNEINNLTDEVNKGEEEHDSLNSRISELEESLESDEGLTMIDFGYDKLWWKSGNLKIQSIMEDFNKKHGIREMEEA